MEQEPKSLRLADALEKDKWNVTSLTLHDAAFELRRLQAENEGLNVALSGLEALVGELHNAICKPKKRIKTLTSQDIERIFFNSAFNVTGPLYELEIFAEQIIDAHEAKKGA